jgi:hypothetical protein
MTSKSRIPSQYEVFLRNREAALLAELNAVRSTLEDLVLRTEIEPAHGVAEQKSHAPTSSGTRDFSDMTLTDAVMEYLREMKEPETPAEISSALMAAGIEFHSDDPARSIRHVLRKRAKDVISVGFGKWDLRSKYHHAQIRAIAKINGGMGGKARKQHVKSTTEGMRRAREAGIRIGATPKIAPEQWQEVERMIRSGSKVPDIAKHFDVTPALIYQRYNRAAIRELRELGTASQDASEPKPRLSVVK